MQMTGFNLLNSLDNIFIVSQIEIHLISWQ